MTRRRLVALVSAAVLGMLALTVLAAGAFLTQTDAGRARVRSIGVPLLAKAVHGSVYVGRLGGNLLTEITVDTFAIRDARGDLVFSAGRVSVNYDPRDLFDRRLVIRRAEVEHPYVHFVQHEDETWNFKKLFKSGGSESPAPKTRRRSLGDFIAIDSVRATGGSFILTLPWHPDDTLRGAARENSIQAHLASTEHVIRPTFDGFGRTYNWTKVRAVLAHARLADPDSDRFGREFHIDTLHAEESDPPFSFRNVNGVVRHLGDSVWFAARHFDLPASSGSGSGKIFWGDDLPVRYDITVRGDSVALNDVAWVYPTLPRTGGGSLILQIKNDPENLSIIDYKLTQMDVRSTNSHLVGQMTFGVGAPVLLVREVDMRADPLNFDLLRTLNGKPFPVDWKGRLVGTVKARGGPLTNFVVDDARGSFHDDHVTGAVSRFSAKGELDILEPALTEFHGLQVDVPTLDLRTIEFLYPSFPRLGGTVTGRARLDSSWLDVRFSDARATLVDGMGGTSEVSGGGRVTYGDLMTYDVDLYASPLSLTVFAKPGVEPLSRASMTGPIVARGTTPDLELRLAMQGDVGSFSFDGRADVDSIGGYGAHGRGEFGYLDLSKLLDNSKIPDGRLIGRYDVDLAGETWAAASGRAVLDLDRTTFDGIRIYPSHLRARFDDGKLFVDSLRIRTDAGMIVANGGAIGLPGGKSESMKVTMSVDSLGGLRRYLATVDTSVALAGRAGRSGDGTTRAPVVFSPDSLAGNGAVSVTLQGRLDSLAASGTIVGNGLVGPWGYGAALSGGFDLHDLFTPSVGGNVWFGGDSVTLAGIKLDTLSATFDIRDSSNARFHLGARSRSGPTALAAGTMRFRGAGQSVQFDSLAIDIESRQWRLAGPAAIASDSTGMRIDGLVMRNADSGSVSVSGIIPRDGDVRAQMRASNLPVADVVAIGQLGAAPITGLGDVSVDVSGTSANPYIVASANVRNIKWGDLSLDRATFTGQHSERLFSGDLSLIRGGRAEFNVSASIPMDLDLGEASARIRQEDPFAVTVRADSTDLSILHASSAFSNASGKLVGRFGMSGKWHSPIYEGSLSLANGSVKLTKAGTTLNNVVADIRLVPGRDSIIVGDISARSAEGPAGNSMKLSGSIWGFAWDKPGLNPRTRLQLHLDAASFRAVDRRSLARLDLSGKVDLTGALARPVLTGSITVPDGAIFLADPEIARKRIVSGIFDDTTDVEASGSRAFASFVDSLRINNLTVNLGDDVRLKSREADVKLGGSLRVVTAPNNGSSRSVSRSDALTKALALTGQLTTNGGSYTLDLGVVRREFSVLPGGTVTFDGTPGFNPLIDIRAQYDVTQYRRADLGVIVNVRGPLYPTPLLDFASNAGYEISQSDLVSYLISGKPGLDVISPDTKQVLANFFAPTLSSVATDALRRSLGSVVDAVRLQLANPDDASDGRTAQQGSLRESLYGATVNVETRVGNKLFLSVSTALCPFDPNIKTQSSPTDVVAARAELRVNDKLSVQAAHEPGVLGRSCNQATALPGFSLTPGQWSLSLFNSWRF